MSSVNAACEVRTEWQAIDRELREIAATRASIDAREAVLLCDAARHELWRKLGKASFLEYLEEVLGYTPKLARERVRVAHALDSMPILADALANNELNYSAVRELTRVATPETEAAWRDVAQGKNVRQIEELVAVHAPGDRPDDAPRPDLKPKHLSFEVSTATFARLRQVQQILADEHGRQLDDDALIDALCSAVLDGGGGEADQGRSRFQVMTTICERCNQGWQLGGGRDIAIDATEVAIAECDAQRIGSDREPGRATQDIPPKTRRYVWRRDKGACRVGGCRAARHLDIHHIVPKHLGGGHEPENLVVLCSGHHHNQHDGSLTITGRAPNIAVTWNVTPHVGRTTVTPPHSGHQLVRHLGTAMPTPVGAFIEPTRGMPHVGRETVTAAADLAGLNPGEPHVGRVSKYERVVMKTEAIQAISQSGFRKSSARGLVEAALDAAPADVTLERLLFDAFRRARST